MSFHLFSNNVASLAFLKPRAVCLVLMFLIFFSSGQVLVGSEASLVDNGIALPNEELASASMVPFSHANNYGEANATLSQTSGSLLKIRDVLEGQMVDVALKDDLGFVADGIGGLKIVNLFDPISPVLLTDYEEAGDVFSVSVDSNFVFLLGSGGVLVLDVSAPLSPRVVSSSYVGVSLLKCEEKNRTLFGIEQISGYQRFVIIDANSRFAYPISVFSPVSGWYQDLALNGSYVFLANNLTGVEILNVSDFSSLHLVGLLGSGLKSASQVFVAGNYLFVRDIEGIKIFDATRFDRISPVSEVLLSSSDFAVLGDYLFVSAFPGLRVFDISNPFSPVEVGTFDSNGTEFLSIEARDGLMLAVDSNDSLDVLNISDVSSPVLVGRISFSRGVVKDIEISGGVGYFASSGGFFVFDVSDPLNLTELGSSYNGKACYGVEVQGDFAYVAVGANGLGIFDVSDPSHFFKVGEAPTNSTAIDVFVSGDLVFVVEGGFGFEIFNVSDPFSPSLVSQYYNSYMVFELIVDGDYAFLANAGAGLEIVDISDPFSPMKLKSYDQFGYVMGMDLVNQTLFLAVYSAQLKVLNASDVANIVELTYFVGEVGVTDVSVFGELALIWGDKGVEVVSIGDPWNVVSVDTYLAPMVEVGYLLGDLILLGYGIPGLAVLSEVPNSSPSISPGDLPSIVYAGEEVKIEVSISVDVGGISEAMVSWNVSDSWRIAPLSFDAETSLYSAHIGPFESDTIVKYFVWAVGTSDLKRISRYPSYAYEFRSFKVVRADYEGPSFYWILHSPTTPFANESVVIEAEVGDESGVSGVLVRYQAGSGQWQDKYMEFNWIRGSYQAIIGPFWEETVVQYYLTAFDMSLLKNTATAKNGSDYFRFFVKALSSSEEKPLRVIVGFSEVGVGLGLAVLVLLSVRSRFWLRD